MPEIIRKRDRLQLEARREPYWQPLAPRCSLGFRRGPDTWIARYKDADGRKHYQALTEADDYLPAKKAAEKWFSAFGSGLSRSIRRGTVRAALDAYLADLRRHGRTGTAEECEGRFRRLVTGGARGRRAADPIAELQLERATRDDFLDWRDRIRGELQPRTVNRGVGAVSTALTRAVRHLGFVGNADAWRLERLPDEVEDEGSAAVFLSPQQRRAMIAAATPAAADFLRGLELTGARPKELAAACVEDFTGAALRLRHRKGRPAKLRVRSTVLSEAGVAFFARMAKGKMPKAPLFTEDGAQTWRRHRWAREINAAIEKHNAKAAAAQRLPREASAYSFRHARISELLQLHGVDPLTVAQQCGTSVAMLERYYWRFIPAALQAKLAAIREAE